MPCPSFPGTSSAVPCTVATASPEVKRPSVGASSKSKLAIGGGGSPSAIAGAEPSGVRAAAIRAAPVAAVAPRSRRPSRAARVVVVVEVVVAGAVVRVGVGVGGRVVVMSSSTFWFDVATVRRPWHGMG